ncbi:MAG: DUF6673 family protein [Oscillospiraceae bacterium]
MVKINGVELDFSLTDPDFLRREQEAIKKKDERIEQAPEVASVEKDPKKYIQFLEAYTDIFKAYFDETFAPGTANKILGEHPDLEACLSAHDEFRDALLKSSVELAERMTRISNKYAPNGATRKE